MDDFTSKCIHNFFVYGVKQQNMEVLWSSNYFE